MVLDLDFLVDTEWHERSRNPHAREWQPSPLRDEVCRWATNPARHRRFVQMSLVQPPFEIYTQQLAELVVFKLSTVLSVITTSVAQLCEDYVNSIRTLKIVREVLLVEAEEITTIWTIIAAPPFEDSFREPIYKAQLHILRSLGDDKSLDFYVLNVLELPDGEELADVLPSNAKLLWQR